MPHWSCIDTFRVKINRAIIFSWTIWSTISAFICIGDVKFWGCKIMRDWKIRVRASKKQKFLSATDLDYYEVGVDCIDSKRGCDYCSFAVRYSQRLTDHDWVIISTWNKKSPRNLWTIFRKMSTKLNIRRPFWNFNALPLHLLARIGEKYWIPDRNGRLF